MPLNLTWRETEIGHRADVGAFSLLAVHDFMYSAVNGDEYFTAAVTFRAGPGRPALVVGRDSRMPRELAATKVAAEQLFAAVVPRVQEAFVGLLSGEVLATPGLGLGAPGDLPATPRRGPTSGGCWLELD